jgi:hypothetical protein
MSPDYDADDVDYFEDDVSADSDYSWTAIISTSLPIKTNSSEVGASAAIAGAISLEDSASNLRTLQKGFLGLFDELAELRPLIFQTEGFWFPRHIYSQEALLAHPVFAKIRSRCGVIENNMSYWRNAGRCDRALESAYEDLKLKVSLEVNDLQRLIANRRSTFWEIVRDTLTSIFARFTVYLAANTLLRLTRGF